MKSKNKDEIRFFLTPTEIELAQNKEFYFIKRGYSRELLITVQTMFEDFPPMEYAKDFYVYTPSTLKYARCISKKAYLDFAMPIRGITYRRYYTNERKVMYEWTFHFITQLFEQEVKQ